MKVFANTVKGNLRDLDTNEIVKALIWFDLDKGTFEKQQLGRNGKPIRSRQGILTHICKGRIRFEPKGTPYQLIEIREKCATCTRQATYAVSDETPLSPVVVKGRQYAFERAKTVATRYYCEWCYQGPRILDAKGEIMEVIEDGGGVRPQGHS